MADFRETEKFKEQPRFLFYVFSTWGKDYEIPKRGKEFLENLKNFRRKKTLKTFLIDFYKFNNEKLPEDFNVKSGRKIDVMFDNLLYTHNLTIESIVNNS